MRREDYDVFVDKFKPYYKPSLHEGEEDFRMETFGEDLDKVMTWKPENIWTIVDADGKWYIIPGMYYVNREYYIITEMPWTEKTRDYFYG